MESVLSIVFFVSGVVFFISLFVGIITQSKASLIALLISAGLMVATLVTFGFMETMEGHKREAIINKACVDAGYKDGKEIVSKTIGTTNDGVSVIYCRDKFGIFRSEISIK